ncbi:MAG: uroporphyrinogen-III C-methyltransferase [Gammaproteobacteria bacterium]
MNESSTTEQQNMTAQQTNVNTSNRLSIILSIVSLVAVLILAGISGALWKKNRLISQKSFVQVNTLKAELSDLNQQVTQSQQQLQQQQKRFKSFINNQTSDNISWQLGEARYLIHLANFSVSFEHNVPVAIELLQTADTRIASLDNPSFLNLRQALANDITTLKGVPEADIPNILLQLNAFGDQIATLPVISTPNAVPEAQPPKHHHHHQPGWKRGLEQSWLQLKQIIVVQYHDQPVGQLITPQNRHYLDLHLQMLLSQAEWACLHQQGTLYTDSMQQAVNWVKNYYVESAPQTQALLNGMTQLQTQNISPTIPDISGSLNVINQEINELSNTTGGANS